MGASIFVRPGSIMRGKGEVVNITPGLRSRAAGVLMGTFGSSPIEIHGDDHSLLVMLERGASVYEGDNMFKVMLEMLNEHSVITVSIEY